MLTLLFLFLMSCLGKNNQAHQTTPEASIPATRLDSNVQMDIVRPQGDVDTSDKSDVLTVDQVKPPSNIEKETPNEVGEITTPKKSEPTSSEEPKAEEFGKVKENSSDTILMEERTDQVAPPKAAVEVDHAPWDQLLRKWVSADGYVDYAGWKKSEAQLDAYLSSLKEYPLTGQESRSTSMAYWINAYNAFTVKLILKNYPVQSIMNIAGGKAWDIKWIELGDKTYSLNQIEHDILRKNYPDPRIHFAVNCAAQSCPPLLNRAYWPNDLDQQLERQTKSFINDSEYNQLSADKLNLSKIFEWYKGDFGDLITYVQKYSSVDISDQAKVRFNNYDWALNGK